MITYRRRVFEMRDHRGLWCGIIPCLDGAQLFIYVCIVFLLLHIWLLSYGAIEYIQLAMKQRTIAMLYDVAP